MKQLVRNMIDKYPISKHGTHIAILEYSTGVSIYIPFNYSFEQNEILTALQSIRPSRGQTIDTEKVLKIIPDVFSFRNGGRPAASKALVIVTDDKPRKDLTKVADPLKKSGVRVYVVTVGKKVSPDDFIGIVPGTSLVYPANSTKEVPGLSESIRTDIAKVVREGEYKYYFQL